MQVGTVYYTKRPVPTDPPMSYVNQLQIWDFIPSPKRFSPQNTSRWRVSAWWAWNEPKRKRIDGLWHGGILKDFGRLEVDEYEQFTNHSSNISDFEFLYQIRWFLFFEWCAKPILHSFYKLDVHQKFFFVVKYEHVSLDWAYEMIYI